MLGNTTIYNPRPDYNPVITDIDELQRRGIEVYNPIDIRKWQELYCVEGGDIRPLTNNSEKYKASKGESLVGGLLSIIYLPFLKK